MSFWCHPEFNSGSLLRIKLDFRKDSESSSEWQHILDTFLNNNFIFLIFFTHVWRSKIK